MVGWLVGWLTAVEGRPADCIYPPTGQKCSGECELRVDCTGLCGGTVFEDKCGVCGGPNRKRCPGCQNPAACNYNPRVRVGQTKFNDLISTNSHFFVCSLTHSLSGQERRPQSLHLPTAFARLRRQLLAHRGLPGKLRGQGMSLTTRRLPMSLHSIPFHWNWYPCCCF